VIVGFHGDDDVELFGRIVAALGSKCTKEKMVI